MKVLRNITLLLGFVCLIAALAAAQATAAPPLLDLQLKRAVDHPIPTTHSDEHLAYEIEVTNNATVTPDMGDDLRCKGTPAEGKSWYGQNPSPTYSYEWLRNGDPIPGESGPWPAAPDVPVHTIVPADEGKSIQCRVTGTSDLDGPGSTYETVSSLVVSPPTWIAPLPAPAPPSGKATAFLLSPPRARAPVNASATTTAGSNQLTRVVSTEGSGTLTSGSKTVTGVSVGKGEFSLRQAISGPGIPGEATGTAIRGGAGSKILTGVNTTSGAFVAGQMLRGEGLDVEGTEIVAVGSSTIELASPVDSSIPAGTKINLYAVTAVTAVGPGNMIELSAPATLSGQQELFAGAQPLEVGQIVSSPAFPTTTGSGDIVAGETLVTGVTTSTGEFAVGQAIAAFGIPGGTVVEEVGSGTVTLSQEPFASGSSVELTARPRVTRFVEGSRATVSDKATASASGVELEGITELACGQPSDWTGTDMTWSFQWLRNGEPISGATGASYVVKQADIGLPTQFQCEVRVVDAGGNEAVSISNQVGAVPEEPSPYIAPRRESVPTLSSSSETSDAVTVEVQLPPGTKAVRAAAPGTGWVCTKLLPTEIQPSIARCANQDPLGPGGSSYPVIKIEAQVLSSAPDSLTTKACVSGGGFAGNACDEDTLSGILPAVPFGFQSFETRVLDQAGNEFAQAGGHPFVAGADLTFTEHAKAQRNAEAGYRGVNGFVREIRTEVPPGFVGNPEALGELCPSTEEAVSIPTRCPAASAVGGITFAASNGHFVDQPIYAIEPEPGTPAQFAFGVAALKPGFSFTLTPELRPNDNYGITLVASPAARTPELYEANVTLCGRGAKLRLEGAEGAAESKFDRCWKANDLQATEKPFLTLPTKCGDEASSTTRILADTWEDPGTYAEAKSTVAPPEGCNALSFEPSLVARPTTRNADSPTGLEVDLSIPPNEDPEGVATAQLKKAVITLPEGMTVNPAGANGLDACSSQQIRLGTNDPITCPSASKVGTVQVETPILGHPLPGSLYVASPHDNPFGSLLALYLVVESPDDGLLIKLPGKVDLNPRTGQIVSTFDQNPQAPVSDVQLKVRGGASAPLRTPETCAKYSIASSLTPWSAPESGPPATPKDSWSINRGPGGGACLASAPNAPQFEAGTASPIAASYSPFVVKLRREDGSQQFSAVNVTPPPGLLAKLAGIPYCPDSALAAAAAKTGKQEQASPSCSLASRVGTVVAGAGAGPAPYYATGTAYLSGPYKGAPISLTVITPAVAGPFDLGNVVTKIALRVDPETAKVAAVSDPLPTILQGIPLDVRSVTVSLDRPSFTLNPTSCDPMAVTGSLISTSGAVAPLENRFQVGECTRLGFKPRLKINLKGPTKRSGNPALTATLTYPAGGYANIASASVALPHSEFLDQAHIRTVCTRVQFAADQCPAGSIYGKARATTPLLDAPLEGPVYLRSSSNPLPDLVADLRGQIHVALVGRIDTFHGGLRTTFDSVPDAPVSKFTLEMQGGKKGLLDNSRDLCKSVNKATAKFTAQNGKKRELRPVLGAKCRSGKGAKRHR